MCVGSTIPMQVDLGSKTKIAEYKLGNDPDKDFSPWVVLEFHPDFSLIKYNLEDEVNPLLFQVDFGCDVYHSNIKVI